MFFNSSNDVHFLLCRLRKMDWLVENDMYNYVGSNDNFFVDNDNVRYSDVSINNLPDQLLDSFSSFVVDLESIDTLKNDFLYRSSSDQEGSINRDNQYSSMYKSEFGSEQSQTPLNDVISSEISLEKFPDLEESNSLKISKSNEVGSNELPCSSPVKILASSISFPITDVEEENSMEIVVLNELEQVLTQLTVPARVFLRDAFYRLAWSSKRKRNQDDETSLPSFPSRRRLESETDAIDQTITSMLFSNPNVNGQDDVCLVSENLMGKNEQVPIPVKTSSLPSYIEEPARNEELNHRDQLFHGSLRRNPEYKPVYLSHFNKNLYKHGSCLSRSVESAQPNQIWESFFT